MREFIIIAATMVVVLGIVRQAYQSGYDQGRNDGFHQGWRECQEMKEETK